MKTTAPSTAEALGDLLHQAERNRFLGRHVEGSAQSRESAARAAAAGDLHTEARALRLLGVHLFRLGELEESAKTCHKAVQLSEQLQDQAGLAEALCSLSIACVELGLHDEALQAATRSLSAAEAVGDRVALCWANNRLGVVHDAMDQRGKASEYLEQALALARQVTEPEALFSSLNNLSEVAIGLHLCHRDQGAELAAADALQRGLRHAEEGIRVARASGSAHQEAIGLCNYGMLTGLARDYERALAQLTAAQDLARTHGYRPLLLMAANYRADLLRLRGDGAAAITEYQTALRNAPPQSDKVLVMRMRLALSRAYKEAGQYREALEEYEQFHVLDREIGSSIAETRTRVLTSRMEADQARLEAERARLEASLLKLRSAELEAEKHRLEAHSEELDRRANEDALTRLWNRRYLEDRLPQLFAQAADAGRPLSVAIADIDHFKTINDRYGHAAGDRVLCRVATLLKSACRPEDLIARIGGEEFIIVLDGSNLQAASAISERLRRSFETALWNELHPELRVTVSFGVSDNATVADPRELLAEADSRLYEAKRGGRNQVVAGP